ncbi:hypothetical protein ACQ4M4_22385 [Leptolyngbya sp. AN02str]|uniref:hypothetical protein n=1 Tax=Leptolyngbya sp. AN02str TaxID=3423363 RepID=UPI003D314C56
MNPVSLMCCQENVVRECRVVRQAIAHAKRRETTGCLSCAFILLCLAKMAIALSGHLHGAGWLKVATANRYPYSLPTTH